MQFKTFHCLISKCISADYVRMFCVSEWEEETFSKTTETSIQLYLKSSTCLWHIQFQLPPHDQEADMPASSYIIPLKAFMDNSL